MDGAAFLASEPIIEGSMLPVVIPGAEELGARAAAFARNSKAPATERAYASDWRGFEAWCNGAGLAALPASPATVGAYLADRAGNLKVATLGRRIAAIITAHRMAGFQLDGKHPAISAVLGGIARRFGARQDAKTAILTAELRRLLRALPATAAGTRDAAILLIGFAGAVRRSELAALDVEDLEVGDQGLIVTIRRSKVDQIGIGRQVGIPSGLATAARAHRRQQRLGLATANIIRCVVSGPIADKYGAKGRGRSNPWQPWAAATADRSFS
jgi:integrase